ncbi:MAG: Outer membrane protein 40 [Candidatus Ordinivivax streblomastigis]|uniref:Outer membrane protein 40 n=1 Tax=Candidatus Ordinivivax streblomastigis TaxID=2540710 RepID=A0A5M8P586_9BACT|nr:MAG: Outer membrane protein 40 [Candidatus Ordinivivax streblomastigis]
MFILLCGVILSALTYTSTAQKRANFSDKNWFISAGVGPNLYIGEQDLEKPVLDLIRFSGSLSGGKWFSSYLGARLHLSMGALRGFNTFTYRNPNTQEPDDRTGLANGGYFQLDHGGSTPYPHGNKLYSIDGHQDELLLPYLEKAGFKLAGISSKQGGPGFWQDFSYASGTVDIMINLNNLLKGTSTPNLIDVIPFVGIGLVYATDPFKDIATASTTQSLEAGVFSAWTSGTVVLNKPAKPIPHFGSLWKGGVQVNYNLNDRCAIYAEPQISFVDEAMDGFVGGRSTEFFLNAFVGFSYTFNRVYATVGGSGLSQAELDYINSRINENRQLVDENRQLVDETRQLVDGNRKLLDEMRELLDETRKLADENRILLDETRNLDDGKSELFENNQALLEQQRVLLDNLNNRISNQKDRIETTVLEAEGSGLSPAELEYINSRINETRQLVDETRQLAEGNRKLLNETRKLAEGNREWIDNNQTLLEKQRALLDNLNNRISDQKGRIETTIRSVTAFLPEFIRYAIDSYTILPSERKKLNETVVYMKAHPDAKLLVTGYADKLTGQSAYNLDLSCKRVEGIVTELEKQGISSNRILKECKGDKEQPFTQNAWNRVVILVTR